MPADSKTVYTEMKLCIDMEIMIEQTRFQMGGACMRILVVEDERRLADALTQIMREQKYAVDAVYDGEDG